MADNTSEVPQGQTSATAPEQGQADVSTEPVFEYTYGDGHKDSFKSKDDLSKAWRDSYLRQSDYTRKTQEVSQTKKQIEEERKKFDDERKAFLDLKKKYDDMDKVLRTRPDVYQQLERVVSAPASPDAVFERSRGYVDETTKALQERLEAMEKTFQQQQTDKELQDVFSKMKSEYEDFDDSAVRELLDGIADGKTESLVRTLHFAHRGRQSPLQAEERVVSNLEKKARAGMVPSGGAAPKPSSRNFKSTDAAREAAMKDLGVKIGG